ncbi:YbjC family protein [Mangrovibacter yixingensis]|uniref:YbjC family protein n=1 Tax=Mangrovibacter yixingensis TaxID=1529639 RepID=UPI001CFC2BBA|nr:YbjC family protein [Mangrovibacter yixingensis]
MRSLGALPKSVLLLETLGIVLLCVAWLVAHGVISVTAFLATDMAVILLIFSGIVLMLPAAIVLIGQMGKHVAPLLFNGSNTQTAENKKAADQAKDKNNDANH